MAYHLVEDSRRDYAVGSYQGGMADPIQTHVWDVTWAVPDPRGAELLREVPQGSWMCGSFDQGTIVARDQIGRAHV